MLVLAVSFVTKRPLGPNLGNITEMLVQTLATSLIQELSNDRRVLRILAGKDKYLYKCFNVFVR